ncbi:MAG: RNA polymerase sigma factor [Ignavibacteriae bacterium]|nr:RNA polymerase sigma factor [Ignavibacteriota bacterium]
MINPFKEKYTEDKTDEELIGKAVNGDKYSFEELIKRHQNWIYNIALRMVFYSDEAKDVTQEVLIKIITKLSSFKMQSSFRTWIYRIVVNHVLNMKKSKGEKSHATNFDDYGKAIDNTPDFDLSYETNLSFDTNIVIEEVKLSCMNGMLLCLDREQRIIFIIGSIFGVADKVGAEIMEISNENFRQKLSRARKDLFNFMNHKCGLIHKSNPCHCSKKAKALVSSGYVNPDNLIFNTNYVYNVKQATGQKLGRLSGYVEKKGSLLFAGQPFQNSPDFVEYIRGLINSDEFKEIFNFN